MIAPAKDRRHQSPTPKSRNCDVTPCNAYHLPLMLRTLTIARPRTSIHLKASLAPTRRYSTPTSSPSTQKNQLPNTLPTSNKKSKIDLRPGPIKPKPTLSSPHLPIKPLRPVPSVANSTLKLGSAKEEVARDISNAEQHGILTAPPADANWFKRILHQAIQLLVRSFCRWLLQYNPHLSVEILLPRREAYLQSPETYYLDQSTYQSRRCPFDTV